MANKFRFILGRSVNTSANLLTNGTFTGGGAGWTTPGTTQWAFAGNVATGGALFCGGGGYVNEVDYLLQQLLVITPDQYYYLQYDLKAAVCAATGNTIAQMSWSMGGTYMNYLEEYDETTDSSAFTTFTHENIFAPAGTTFTLYLHKETKGILDNVILYPYNWNSQLTSDPVNWDKAKITKKRDKELNGLITQYIQDLIFIDDGYNYIYNRFVTQGICDEIPFLIQQIDSNGAYQDYFEGSIFINECNFDTTLNQVRVNVHDKNASLVFLKSKDVKINIRKAGADGTAGMPLISTTAETSLIFTNNAGADANVIDVYNVSNLLKKIIIKASNYRLDATSTFFTSGTFNNFCVGSAAVLRTGIWQTDASKMSIKELFDELNNLFDLSFSITINASGVSTIKIEPKINYLNPVPVLTLNYVNGINFSFDKDNILRTINIGYEKIDDSVTQTFLNTPKGTEYHTNNICSDNKLDLVSKLIQSTLVLKKLMSGTITSTKYDNDLFWIETDGTRTKNTGSGTYDFNFNIDTQDNLVRWMETLQLQFVTASLTGSTIATKTNASIPSIYTFKYPITKAQFDLITQAFDTILFDTDGTGATTKIGYLLQGDFECNTGLTDFTLLSY